MGGHCNCEWQLPAERTGRTHSTYIYSRLSASVLNSKAQLSLHLNTSKLGVHLLGSIVV